MNGYNYHTAPRLYVECDLQKGAQFSLHDDHAHYLRHVMRQSLDAPLRLFNGRMGEWAGRISKLDKKTVEVEVLDQLRPQPVIHPIYALAFAPLKGPRLDILIEKAVELGVSDLYPVITAFTQNRHINAARLNRQITEAAEQCERLTLPILHEPCSLKDFIEMAPQPIYVALERAAHPHIKSFSAQKWSFLVGPEGGFSQEEKEYLAAHEQIQAISLGKNILRAETAALAGLSFLILSNK
jgi:16S rRNA (uracil1498-N3)-methyltransferase